MAHVSLNTPVGLLTVFEADGAIAAIDWGRAPDPEPTPLLDEAVRQLQEYFAGTRRDFDLPLALPDAPFLHAVCEAMLRIPWGEHRTYGEIASEVGGVARAVGRACGDNPIAIVVPCHRVVGADGSMTGYSGGAGIETKLWLLRHEGDLLL